MQLEHQFTVPVPIERAWEVMLDVETLAPCMPGAILDEVRGTEVDGRVKVKLGPIAVTYSGTATFLEIDEAGRRLVIKAAGKETRGSGTANATITAVLVSSGDVTDVAVTTDLAITGKPAQFARGVMVDVSNKLLGQFVDCLSAKITAEPATAEQAPPADAAVPQSNGAAGAPVGAVVRPEPVAEPEPIDLMGAAGAPVLKRLAPLAAVAVLALVLVRRWRS